MTEICLKGLSHHVSSLELCLYAPEFSYLIAFNCTVCALFTPAYLKWLVTAGQFCIERKNQKKLVQWDGSWSFSWYRKSWLQPNGRHCCVPLSKPNSALRKYSGQAVMWSVHFRMHSLVSHASDVNMFKLMHAKQLCLLLVANIFGNMSTVCWIRVYVHRSIMRPWLATRCTCELHFQVSGPGLPQLSVICHMGLIALSLDPLFVQI